MEVPTRLPRSVAASYESLLRERFLTAKISKPSPRPQPRKTGGSRTTSCEEFLHRPEYLSYIFATTHDYDINLKWSISSSRHYDGSLKFASSEVERNCAKIKGTAVYKGYKEALNNRPQETRILEQNIAPSMLDRKHAAQQLARVLVKVYARGWLRRWRDCASRLASACRIQSALRARNELLTARATVQQSAQLSLRRRQIRARPASTTCAVHMQRIYRGYAGRRRAALFKKIKRVDDVVAAARKVHSNFRLGFQTAGAAFRLRCALKAWVQRKRGKAHMNEKAARLAGSLVGELIERTRKARVIRQLDHVRRRVAVRTLVRRLAQQRRRKRDAALNIQRWVRGIWGRFQVSKLTFDRDVAKEVRRLEKIDIYAAVDSVKTWFGGVVLVSRTKRHREQFEKNRRRLLPAFRARVDFQSAVIIQSMCRGCLARLRFRVLKLKRRVNARNARVARRESASIQIQMLIRRHQSWVECRNRKRIRSQTIIATWYRQYLACRQVQSLRGEIEAAALIQRHYRALYQLRRSRAEASRTDCFEAPARKIQRWVRWRFMRRGYLNARRQRRRRAEEQEYARGCVIVCRSRARNMLMLQDLTTTGRSSARRLLKGALLSERALVIRTDALMAQKLIVIKMLGRRYLARVQLQRNREEREMKLVCEKKSSQVIHIQKVIRSFLARSHCAHIARGVYLKIKVAQTGDTYYVNQTTSAVLWAKPRLLGSSTDLETVALCPDLEFIVNCVNCSLQASCHCPVCEASFCIYCAALMHQKGNRLSHSLNIIERCSRCSYQHATKACISCMVVISKKNAYLCDVCFAHTHSDSTHSLTMNWRDSNNPKRAKQSNHHTWTWLVVPCVETCTHAATLFCKVCEDFFCRSCFVTMHRRGKKMNHGFNYIGFLTPSAKDVWWRSVRESTRRKLRNGAASGVVYEPRFMTRTSDAVSYAEAIATG